VSPVVLSAIGVARIVVTVLVIASSGCATPFQDEYERFRAIKPGMKEAEVLERLGAPTKAFTKADVPPDYYVEGYAYEEREVTGKVLIYVSTEPIAYVYLDDTGVVEHVFVGES
jgi:hypothetical protein